MKRVLTFAAYTDEPAVLLGDEPPTSAVVFQMLNDALYLAGGPRLKQGEQGRSDEVRRRNAGLQRVFRKQTVTFAERAEKVPVSAMARRLKPEGAEIVLDRLDYEHVKEALEAAQWGTALDCAYDDAVAFLKAATEQQD